MSNGTITMTGAEYDALAGKIAALEAELAKLKGEYEWVTSINTALDESNQRAWGELARLRAPATVSSVNQQLLEALEAILPFIPNTSAAEGGAARYSENVRAADKVRAAIDAARQEGGKV